MHQRQIHMRTLFQRIQGRILFHLQQYHPIMRPIKIHLVINNMKHIFRALFLISIFSLLFIFHVDAATSYPIQALGNCRDAKECFYYCEIPRNSASCWSYKTYVMQGQVLAETIRSEPPSAQAVTFPIAELGNCSSREECMKYCQEVVNQQACADFAKKKGLQKGSNQGQSGEPKKLSEDIMKAAATELGCTSEQTCKEICEKEESREKCRKFAESHNLNKQRSQNSAPSNTQSIQKQPVRLPSCVPGESQMRISKPVTSSAPVSLEQIMKEKGCKTGAECFEYCKNHPTECPGFRQPPLQISRPPVSEALPPPQ